MTSIKHLYILIYLLFMGNIIYAQSLQEPAQPAFSVYDTRTGEKISITELADRIINTDVLFWGEEHDDNIGHILELKMLKLLQERYPNRLTLSLEMFETDCQHIVDEYCGGFINEEKFLSLSRPWSNYKEDYRPLVEFAKDNAMPIIAANSPRRYNSIVSKRGVLSLDSLPRESKKFIAALPLQVPYNGAYHKKFTNLMNGTDMIHTKNMFAAQCLWDATMAQRIQKAISNSKKNGLVFHICGRFHSDGYLGTVGQIRKRKFDTKVLTISCFPSDSFKHVDIESIEGIADFVVLTEQKPTE